jgi:hypothetical protein
VGGVWLTFAENSSIGRFAGEHLENRPIMGTMSHVFQGW